MPFNGSGTFVRVYNWVTDKINGVNITASRVDTEDDGFAAGLTNCVTRDGQGKMAAAFNPSADASYDLGAPSAQWRNTFLSGALTGNSVLEKGGRFFKTAAQTMSGTTPIADTVLVTTPTDLFSYELEAKLLFTASNSSAQSAGLKVGFFAEFINFNCGFCHTYGLINNTQVMSITGGYASTPASGAAYAFPTLAAGVGANWLIIKGSLNILNFTGPPLIGVNWGQNSAAGGTLTVETGSYLKLTRFS